jgi:hypothetical protein
VAPTATQPLVSVIAVMSPARTTEGATRERCGREHDGYPTSIGAEIASCAETSARKVYRDTLGRCKATRPSSVTRFAGAGASGVMDSGLSQSNDIGASGAQRTADAAERRPCLRWGAPPNLGRSRFLNEDTRRGFSALEREVLARVGSIQRLRRGGVNVDTYSPCGSDDIR